jgi:hypothetical protein
MEHYRLHTMEQWPDGPLKDAGLAAVRSTLETLARTAPTGMSSFECVECLSNRNRARLIQFRSRGQTELAA